MAEAFPFFSPDGQSVWFFADGKLKRVSLGGGPQITLCYAGVVWHGGSWNSQDTIVFSAGSKPSETTLYRVSALGGEPEIVAAPDLEKGESDYSCPKFLPGGKALFFDVFHTNRPSQIRVLSLETGEQKTVVEDGINAYRAATGPLVYQQRGTLVAAPFDLSRLEVIGNAAPVMKNIRGVDYAIAEDGTLVYVPSAAARGRYLVWVDREGTERMVAQEKQPYHAPGISPDGRRVAIKIADDRRTSQVWIYDLEEESFRQLTYEGRNVFSPVWTPDGQWITFSSNRDGQVSIYRKRADGSARAERLTTSQFIHASPSSWSPDGNVLAFSHGGHSFT